MKELMARCGINCSQCEAFIATMSNDKTELKLVAEQASAPFSVAWAGGGVQLAVKDVMCEGSFSNRLA